LFWNALITPFGKTLMAGNLKERQLSSVNLHPNYFPNTTMLAGANQFFHLELQPPYTAALTHLSAIL
jgi:hypothetical protein